MNRAAGRRRGAADGSTAPPGARLAVGLAYDGTGFHGVAAQRGQRTVAGELAAVLAELASLDTPPAITCAGRTDAGVHALGQVVHADLPREAIDRRFGDGPAARTFDGFEPLPRLARALTARLGPEVAIWRAAFAPDGFDARRSATSRRYRFDVSVAAVPDPLEARTVWQLCGPLELAPMRIACDRLVGEHDFAAFCRQPPRRRDEEAPPAAAPPAAAPPAADRPAPIVRRVLDARLVVRPPASRRSGAAWRSGSCPGSPDSPWPPPGVIRFEIEANAFCQQMVRSIVGLLVAIGAGRARPSVLGERLQSGERAGLPAVAPPHGLCLLRVGYPGGAGALLDRAAAAGAALQDLAATL